MRQLICNTNNPDLYKIAYVTGNKMTKVHKSGSTYYCYLNGKKMTCSEARQEMLKDVTLVNLSGFPISL